MSESETMTQGHDDELLRVREAAIMRGVSVHTIYKWIKSEGLPAQYVLGVVCVRRGDATSFRTKSRPRGRPKGSRCIYPPRPPRKE